MTPFARLLRNAAQKVAGVFYEGEQPPERLGQLVEDFAAWHPKAPPEEWKAFARGLAEEAYRTGYARGFERAERVPGDALPQLPPELVADNIDPGWWQRPHLGQDGEGNVVEEEIEPREMVPQEPEE